ncbi:TerB family tellurite resistance protein [Candidatus Pelagibacter sp.]|nr:TerB family tellurite resistance protein [Candidatus Pelagibacter sp.]
MLDLLNKKSVTKDKDDLLSKTASLLVHAAKIDENYTEKEKKIIKETLIKLGAEKSSIDQIMSHAEVADENANHILDFTKKIKNSNNDFKIQIIKALWNIIYSNKEEDMYESNLMRRLAGLLYLDNKVMADIKKKVKQELNK